MISDDVYSALDTSARSHHHASSGPASHEQRGVAGGPDRPSDGPSADPGGGGCDGGEPRTSAVCALCRPFATPAHFLELHAEPEQRECPFRCGQTRTLACLAPGLGDFWSLTGWPIAPNCSWILSFSATSEPTQGTVTVSTPKSQHTTDFTLAAGAFVPSVRRHAEPDLRSLDQLRHFVLVHLRDDGLDRRGAAPYHGVAIAPSPFISTSPPLTLDNQPDGQIYARVRAARPYAGDHGRRPGLDVSEPADPCGGCICQVIRALDDAPRWPRDQARGRFRRAAPTAGGSTPR